MAYCYSCDEWCGRNEFSKNQWRKGQLRRCRDCTGDHGYRSVCDICGKEFRSEHHMMQHRVVHNARRCSKCGRNCSPDDYSTNQWLKGAGISRCRDCVNTRYICHCGRGELASTKLTFYKFMLSPTLKFAIRIYRWKWLQAAPENTCCAECQMSSLWRWAISHAYGAHDKRQSRYMSKFVLATGLFTLYTSSSWHVQFNRVQ